MEGRRESVGLSLILAVLVTVEIRAAALRPLWFDELSTLFVASAASMKEMFEAIPLDGNPPLYFLLARFSLHLPIKTELALRLPSIAAINIAALMVYLFVRRGTSTAFAFLATSFFVAGYWTCWASTEGRPYAILLCFTTICLCCWQSATRMKHRRWSIAGIACATAAAVFSHHYGIVYVCAPLFAGEAVRTYKTKRLDLPIFIAIAIGALPLLFTIPAMLSGQAPLLAAVKRSNSFGDAPHLHDLSFYWTHLPLLIPVLVALSVCSAPILSFLAIPRQDPESPPVDESDQDVGAGLGLLLLLPIILSLTRLGSGYFAPRYTVGTVLGVAILSGHLLYRLNIRWAVLERFVPVPVFYGFAVAIFVLWFAGPMQPNAGDAFDPVFLAAPKDKPIVMASSKQFTPTWWYTDASTRARLHYLSDLNDAAQRPKFIGEYSLALEQTHGAPRIDQYQTFLASHREFLLFCHGDETLEWIRNRLITDGWNLTPLVSEGTRVLYSVTAPRAISQKDPPISP